MCVKLLNGTDMYKTETLWYKGKKIIKYCPTDYVGFYTNNQHQVLTVRGKSYEQVCEELDKVNVAVAAA